MNNFLILLSILVIGYLAIPRDNTGPGTHYALTCKNHNGDLIKSSKLNLNGYPHKYICTNHIHKYKG